MLAGRANGLSYAQAAEYSFIIAIPILTGAIIRSLFQLETLTLLRTEPGAVSVGILAAMVSGWFAIDFMLRILRTRGLLGFGVYRILLALVLLWVGS
jgi:undecaprenyl-diphosphatase